MRSQPTIRHRFAIRRQLEEVLVLEVSTVDRSPVPLIRFVVLQACDVMLRYEPRWVNDALQSSSLEEANGVIDPVVSGLLGQLHHVRCDAIVCFQVFNLVCAYVLGQPHVQVGAAGLARRRFGRKAHAVIPRPTLHQVAGHAVVVHIRQVGP